MIRERIKIWLFITLLTVCGTASFASCSSNEDNATKQSNGKVAEIIERGTILFGTTGDYRPLSFCEPDGTYWGFGIEIANEIAKRLGVSIEFKKTSWPTLTADVLTEPQLFDLAIGGITITDARRETMLMSEGYLANGKTILCRASEADRYKSLADIDKPEVTVMVNPGGLNEKFANEKLTHAKIVVDDNRDNRGSLLCEDRHPTYSPITERPLYSWRNRRPHAERAGRPLADGKQYHPTDEVRWHTTQTS